MIITPQMLWADFNVAKEPLDARRITTKEAYGAKATYFYFNGVEATDGIVRIFSILYTPINIQTKKTATKKVAKQLPKKIAEFSAEISEIKKEIGDDLLEDTAIQKSTEELLEDLRITNKTDNLIIVFADVETDSTNFNPSVYIDNGFCVLVVDYSGLNDKKQYATIYPISKSFANAFYYPDAIKETNELYKSSWFIWQTIALRAVFFAQNLDFKNIFMLGYGHGGEQVYKTACFPFETETQEFFAKNPLAPVTKGSDCIIRGAVTVFTSGVIYPEILQFKAALDSSSYAKDAKCPILMQLTSNEQNSGLDEMNDLFTQSLAKTNLGRVSIVERTNRTLDNVRDKNPLLWFKSILANDKIPASPIIQLKSSNNKLYCELKIDDYKNMKQVTIFSSHIQEKSAYRNWRNLEFENPEKDEYLAFVPIINSEKPVYIFASVIYNSGISLSSPVAAVVPKFLNITVEPPPVSRRIYDTDFGQCDWLDLDASPDSSTLVMKEGAFGLEGITSTTNKLTTFRLADPQFIGPANANLQCLVYSKLGQKLFFTITTNSNLEKYYFDYDIVASKGWTKINISNAYFKSNNGNNLESWSDILTFSINSSEEFLLNSLLWV